MPLYIFNRWDADEEESLIAAVTIQRCVQRALGRALCPLHADLAGGGDAAVCVALESRLPASEEKNTTFGSGNSAGPTAGSGPSVEHCPSAMTWPSEMLKFSKTLTKSKSI